MPPLVTVIIPTVAEKSREIEIKRCIQSVRKSSVNQLKIITIVNGNRYDDGICRWLKSQNDIHYEYLATGSLPNAISYGRSLVATPFFSTIDDDDEYLEGSTDKKLEALITEPTADLVVTNGYRCVGGRDTPLYTRFNQVSDRPLTSLFNETWLNSGNALYRSDSIETSFFEEYHSFAEWTWLAFQLTMAQKKVITLDSCEFRIHDTAESLSKSRAYDMSYFALFKRMLAAGPPTHIKQFIRKKLGAAHHTEACKNLNEGQRIKATKHHLLSLLYPGASRYLLYSRKLIPGWPL